MSVKGDVYRLCCIMMHALGGACIYRIDSSPVDSCRRGGGRVGGICTPLAFRIR